MSSCNECGRFQCDCEVMTLDVYDTEIVPGEVHYESEYGETLHEDNVINYFIERGLLIKKTR